MLLLAQEVSGFLPINEWLPFLNTMLDQLLAGILERGIRWGFRIGSNRSSPLESATCNMGSVSERPEVVSLYIAEEVAAGRLVPSPAIQLSPIGIIPKKNKPNKFRMIVSPKGRNINDGFCKEDSSFHYASFADAAKRIVACGWGALMAKFDLKSANRMVPVHPGGSPLLGIEWDSTVYVDPFGLRSTPIIFSAMADGLAWASG